MRKSFDPKVPVFVDEEIKVLKSICNDQDFIYLSSALYVSFENSLVFDKEFPLPGPKEVNNELRSLLISLRTLSPGTKQFIMFRMIDIGAIPNKGGYNWSTKLLDDLKLAIDVNYNHKRRSFPRSFLKEEVRLIFDKFELEMNLEKAGKLSKYLALFLSKAKINNIEVKDLAREIRDLQANK